MIETENELGRIHARLHEHFLALCALREPTRAPVFALEHGLSRNDMDVLAHAVRESVRLNAVVRKCWLPYVVYSTEVGYSYAGEVFWPIFESRTPGWTEYGKRNWVRNWFRKFEVDYAGAQPTGPWAETFSIISRPITNAILPTDLQRQLAQLLYENRKYLALDLLDDPEKLGQALAVRSWNMTARFKVFCQNTSILGRVAAALLGDRTLESPFLLDSTLDRIVRDLSAERQAHAWLENARMSATRIRLRGAKVGPGDTTGPRADPEGRPRRGTLRVSPFVRGTGSEWRLFVEFPDLVSLLEVAPGLIDDIKSKRVLTPFSPDVPLAGGRLLIPPQHIRAQRWPSPDTPAVVLEGGSEFVNSVLAEQIVKPSGDRLLFEIADDGVGVEVRSGRLRAGRTFLLLGREDLPTRRPDWIRAANVNCDDLAAHLISVPELITEAEARELDGADLEFGGQVEVFPVGVSPLEWDGDGYAAWLSTDDPILGIRSTIEVASVSWEVDAEVTRLPWVAEQATFFAMLANLSNGSHRVRIALWDHEGEEPLASTNFEVEIREASSQLDTGNIQEGLMILPSPAQPTISEVWEGRADVQIVGPRGVKSSVQLRLFDNVGSELVKNRWSLSLPVSADEWHEWFDRNVRGNPTIQSEYDAADSCQLEVSREEVGRVCLRCDREFSALRWICVRSRSKRIMRLIDNTDSVRARVQLFPFATPDRPVDIELDDGELRLEHGGMLVASTESLEVSMIGPRSETRSESFSALSVSPTLNPTHSSKAGLIDLIDLARRWWSASVSADPDVRTSKAAVLETISTRISQVVGGVTWVSFERDHLFGRQPFSVDALQVALGGKLDARRLAPSLSDFAVDADSATTRDQAMPLARLLGEFVPESGVRIADSEIAYDLLLLAAQPGELDRSSVDDLAALVFECPLAFRAARMVALEVTHPRPDLRESLEQEFSSWK